MFAEVKRPMVFIAVFSAAAAVLCAFGPGVIVAVAAVIIAAVVCRFIFRRSTLTLIAALIFALAVAAGFNAMERRALKLASEYDGKEITLEGEVCRLPAFSDTTESYTLKTELGLVSLMVYGGGVQAEIGDRLSLQAKLGAPALPDNDYAFNSREYNYSSKIFLTATAKGKVKVEECEKVTPRILAGRLQNAAAMAALKNLDYRAYGLYCAVVLGDKRYMDGELKLALNRAGLSHTAAVSGMHLSIVAAMITLLLSRLLGRGRLSSLAVIAAVAAYTMLTGAGNSVVRAFVMCTIYLAAGMLYRDADPLSSLAAAVTVMLLFNPMVIYSAGFQLSVLSTLSILLFMPLWEPKLHKLPKLPRIAAEAALVGIAAQIGVFPVIICVFNSFPTYFILANLLVVPLLSVAIPLGLLLPVMGQISYLGSAWGWVCSLMFGYMSAAAKKISALPGAALTVGDMDEALIAAYISAAAALWFLFKGKKLRLTALFAATTVIFAAIGGIRVYGENRKSSLSFINVGRGDCAIFCLPCGRTVLLDGGSSGYEAQQYLSGSGRGSVDAAVLTSDKREHIGGIAALLEAGFIERLYISAPANVSEACRELTAAAAELNVPVTYVGEGTGIYIGGLSLKCGAYNESMSITAEYGGKRIFFAADGHTPWPENCLLVKAPNHGSGKYNCLSELKRAAPKYAVISGTAYAAERGAVSKTLTELDIPFFITDECGTVTIDLESCKVSTTK